MKVLKVWELGVVFMIIAMMILTGWIENVGIAVMVLIGWIKNVGK